MIDIEGAYEYEVAFSFLQEDEGIAYELNDLIQDRFKTFLYSERQKELVGTDGEKTFNEVFGEKARIVIVLYREDWGTTAWTRIEETAIRNRAHNEGYDFTTFVQLDPKSKMPKWLPKTRIYYNHDRWGTKGLAPVIEAKIQEAGGESRPDTIEDQAARLKRQILNQNERRFFLNSSEGYVKAQQEFDKLYNLLQTKTKELEDPEMQLFFGYEFKPGHKFVVRCEGYSLHFSWEVAYNNSLTNSTLYVDLAQATQDASNAFFENSMYGRSKETAIKSVTLNFDISPINKDTGWSVKTNETDFFSSEKLMHQWLKMFLEKVSKKKIERQRAG
jgi:hypothetical protein